MRRIARISLLMFLFVLILFLSDENEEKDNSKLASYDSGKQDLSVKDLVPSALQQKSRSFPHEFESVASGNVPFVGYVMDDTNWAGQNWHPEYTTASLNIVDSTGGTQSYTVYYDGHFNATYTFSQYGERYPTPTGLTTSFSTAYVVNVYDNHDKCYYVTDSTANWLYVRFTNPTPNSYGTCEFFLNTPATVAWTEIYLSDGTNNLYRIYFDSSGNLFYWNGTTAKDSTYNLNMDEWVHFHWEYHNGDKSSRLWRNGELVVPTVPIYDNSWTPGSVTYLLVVSGSNPKTYRIDAVDWSTDKGYFDWRSAYACFQYNQTLPESVQYSHYWKFTPDGGSEHTGDTIPFEITDANCRNIPDNSPMRGAEIQYGNPNRFVSYVRDGYFFGGESNRYAKLQVKNDSGISEHFACAGNYSTAESYSTYADGSHPTNLYSIDYNISDVTNFYCGHSKVLHLQDRDMGWDDCYMNIGSPSSGTIDMWLYVRYNPYRIIIYYIPGNWGDNFNFVITAGGDVLILPGDIDSGADVSFNQWTHLRLVFDMTGATDWATLWVNLRPYWYFQSSGRTNQGDISRIQFAGYDPTDFYVDAVDWSSSSGYFQDRSTYMLFDTTISMGTDYSAYYGYQDTVGLPRGSYEWRYICGHNEGVMTTYWNELSISGTDPYGAGIRWIETSNERGDLSLDYKIEGYLVTDRYVWPGMYTTPFFDINGFDYGFNSYDGSEDGGASFEFYECVPYPVGDPDWNYDEGKQSSFITYTSWGNGGDLIVLNNTEMPLGYDVSADEDSTLSSSINWARCDNGEIYASSINYIDYLPWVADPDEYGIITLTYMLRPFFILNTTYYDESSVLVQVQILTWDNINWYWNWTWQPFNDIVLTYPQYKIKLYDKETKNLIFEDSNQVNFTFHRQISISDTMITNNAGEAINVSVFYNETSIYSTIVSPYSNSLTNLTSGTYTVNVTDIYGNLLEQQTITPSNFTITYTPEELRDCLVSLSDQRNNYLDFYNYRIYINGTQIYDPIFQREIGTYWNITVYDRFDYYISCKAVTINRTNNYVNIQLTRHSLKVFNQQEEFAYVNVTRVPYTGEYWSEWLAPTEIAEYFLFSGNYKLNVTEYENTTTTIYDYTLNGDDLLIISSANTISNAIANIQNVNATIGNQITNVEINITNQNSMINNSILNVDIHIASINSTLGLQLISIDSSIQNLNTTMGVQFSYVVSNITNINSTIVSQFSYIESVLTNINSSIISQVLDVLIAVQNINSSIGGQITALNLSITNQFTNMSSQITAVSVDIANINSSINSQFIDISSSISNVNSTMLAQFISMNASIYEVGNWINTSYVDLNASVYLVNNSIYNAVSVVSASLFQINNTMNSSVTLLLVNSNYLTQIFQRSMFPGMLNWSKQYNITEDLLYIPFVNQFKNDTIEVEMRYLEEIDKIQVSAQNQIEKFVPKEGTDYRIYSVSKQEYLTDWEPITPETKNVTFGYYTAEEVPEFEMQGIGWLDMLVMILVTVGITLVVTVPQIQKKKQVRIYREAGQSSRKTRKSKKKKRDAIEQPEEITFWAKEG